MVPSVTLGILYGKKAQAESKGPRTLDVSTWAFEDVRPVPESNIGATTLNISRILSPASDGTSTLLVYSGSNGGICIRSRTGSTWNENVRCVTNANPLHKSPYTILDWLGGPSIYFISSSNTISGIDYVPQNDTWKLSSIVNHKIQVNAQSKIASVTWLNGSSSWLYYQDIFGFIKEYGIDDYRDISWREGTVDSLGLAQIGSDIGISRWLNGTAEVAGLFYQQSVNAIVGRTYQNSRWMSEDYLIQGGQSAGSLVSGFCTTSFASGNSSAVIIAYAGLDGYLYSMTKQTSKLPSENTEQFSSAIAITEVNEKLPIGLAIVAQPNTTTILYATNQQRLVQVESHGLLTSNLTINDTTITTLT